MIRSMNNFLVRFFLFFGVIFGIIFMAVWFYLSVTAPADAAEPHAAEPHANVQKSPNITFEAGQVRILSPYGGSHDFKVEIAKTPDQLRLGLMYRDHLNVGTGMLFVYKPAMTVGMWMKNTKISLDMVFADRLGRVVYIAQKTQPMSEDVIQAPGRIGYVLELPAGTTQSLGIVVGHRLTF